MSLANTSLDTLSRVAYVRSQVDVILANKMNKGLFVHRALKENIWNAKFVMYFPKNFYLTEAINKKISLYLSSGILAHFIDRYIDLRYFNMKEESNGPTKICLAHMKGAFILWIILIGFSSFVFILELFVRLIPAF